MLSVLAAGTLLKDPQERRGKTGRTFATALMRVPVEGADAMLCSLIAFRGAAVDALMVLAAGDALAVSGAAKLTSWEKDGQERHGLNVTVEAVMTPYQLATKRARAQAATAANGDSERNGGASKGDFEGNDTAPRGGHSRRQAPAVAGPGGPFGDLESDIPF